MTSDSLSTFYNTNQPLLVSLGALAAVGLLLLAANRLRAMKEHRATLLVANLLTIIAAGLATMVSASGMWKFFTDILGATPLRIAFFAFIEIALFASALLARSRLLREPDKGTTGVDGIAVWALAGLTATLSALDSDSFREVCLRLVAPLVAAWMWERALAAERNVRLGRTARRINWTVTPERIFMWLRIAKASDRDVSDIDRARRRARLGRARLHLHLLQGNKKTSAWRLRRAHRNVIKQAMQASEHIGLADFPQATTEREAIQMYMATIYGFVEATSPQAVAHLNAWQTSPPPLAAEGNGTHHAVRAQHGPFVSTTTAPSNQTPIPTAGPDAYEDQLRAARTNSAAVLASHVPAAPANGPRVPLNGATASVPHTALGLGTAIQALVPPQLADDDAHIAEDGPSLDLNGGSGATRNERRVAEQTGSPLEHLPRAAPDEEQPADEFDDEPGDDEQDTSAVTSMRRFWDQEVANGRVPTGAQLSRAAGVRPKTGLGRRKRREWEAELPEHLEPTAVTGAAFS
jgi:hypothetical protein